MSDIVTVRTELRAPTAITAAERRLGLGEPTHGTAQLFSGDATEVLAEFLGCHLARGD